MTSTELKDLVKSHFNLVEAEVVEEIVETEVQEQFGELKDINGAFTIKFPGDSLQVGDKVTVVTAEGQEMDAPDGEHELEDGTKIVTEESTVKEIISADGEKAMAEEEEEAKEEMAEESFEEVAEEPVEEEMEVEVEVEEAKVEDIIEAIISEVKDEMKKMEEKMATMESKIQMMEDAPAAEPTLTSTGKKVEASKFSKFDVEGARNADRIKMALKQIKNKK